MHMTNKDDIHLTVHGTIKCKWIDTFWSYLDVPRPNHGFLIVLNGQVNYHLEEKSISLYERDVIYLPKGSKYKVSMPMEVTTLLVNFDIINFEDFLLEPFKVLHDTPGILCDIFSKIYVYNQHPNRKNLLVKSYTYLLYHHILDLQNDTDADHRLIRDAKFLLTENKDLSINQIAQKLLVSSSGLRKKFKAFEGMSLAEYRTKSRLNEAKTLLISTDLPINQIASQCGFYDTAYFYKIFCKTLGMTPKKYRKTVGGNI